jgi:hypothetical protein
LDERPHQHHEKQHEPRGKLEETAATTSTEQQQQQQQQQQQTSTK